MEPKEESSSEPETKETYTEEKVPPLVVSLSPASTQPKVPPLVVSLSPQTAPKVVQPPPPPSTAPPQMDEDRANLLRVLEDDSPQNSPTAPEQLAPMEPEEVGTISG